jgi:hypothetical protein
MSIKPLWNPTEELDRSGFKHLPGIRLRDRTCPVTISITWFSDQISLTGT